MFLKGRTEITSKELAKMLNKRHDHVLRDIRSEKKRWVILKDISHWYIKDTYLSDANQQRLMYKISREGLEALLYRYVRVKDVALEKYTKIKGEK